MNQLCPSTAPLFARSRAQHLLLTAAGRIRPSEKTQNPSLSGQPGELGGDFESDPELMDLGRILCCWRTGRRAFQPASPSDGSRATNIHITQKGIKRLQEGKGIENPMPAARLALSRSWMAKVFLHS